MLYLVKLAGRALRDMADIYEFIHADASEAALQWFNDLAEAIYSLERFPERGSSVPENKKFRQLFFGKKPHTYRIIYTVNKRAELKRNRVVTVLHIRHGVRSKKTAPQ
jgi:toxin ParE1/3/4